MENNSKTIIVFYSKEGNTKQGAQILCERLKCPFIELKEVKKGNFIQAIFKKKTKLIGTPWLDIKEADLVYLMLPIWASNGVPAMNAFLEQADFTGKEVVIITFQQFEDLKDSDLVHDYIESIVAKKGGSQKACYALQGGKMGHPASEEFIKKQIDKVRT